MVLTRMALARTALTKMRSAANPRTGRRAAAVTRCAAPAVKQPQGFHRATAVPSAAGGSVTVRRISLTTEDRGGELEARRERHLALIIADWRQRKDGAEPSAEELKQMSGMLDDLSEMHRVQNAGAPPDDTHVQQWFGISTTSKEVSMPAVGEHFWSSSGQHCSFDGDWGAAWEAHDQSKLPVKLKAINKKQRSERISPDDDEWMAYQPSYSEGDKLGLALDLEGGTLTAFKNGIRLGVVVPNEKVESLGEGPFCWAVDLEGPGSAVRISEGLPTSVKYNQLRHDHTGAETSSILVF